VRKKEERKKIFEWRKKIIFGVVVVGEDFQLQLGSFWRGKGFSGEELKVDLPLVGGGYLLAERTDIDNDGVAEGLAIFYKTEKKEAVNFYPIFFEIFEYKGRRKGWEVVFEEKINEHWGREFPLEEMRQATLMETEDLKGNEKEEIIVRIKRMVGGEEIAEVWVFGEKKSGLGILAKFEGLKRGEVKVWGERLVVEAEGKERYFEVKGEELVEVLREGEEAIEAKNLLIGSLWNEVFAFDLEKREKVLKVKSGEVMGGDYSVAAKKIFWVQKRKTRRGILSEIWGVDLVAGGVPQKIITGEDDLQKLRNFEEPKVSPDGKRLAFREKGLADTALYVSDIDGTGMRKILEQGDYGVGSYSWLKDGKGIVYFSQTMLFVEPTPSNQLKIVEIESGEEAVLTTNVYTTCGVPIEVGEEIFYAASGEKEDLDCALYKVRKDGKGFQRLTNFLEGEKSGDLVGSEDGRYIAFVVSRGGKAGEEGRVLVWKTNGEQVAEFNGGQARFNQEGERLAVKRGGRVFLVDLSGGGEEEVRGLNLISIWDWK
jgi:hypothetical protein